MNEVGVTEHIEGDACKMALWSGTVAPTSDYKVILRVGGVVWCGGFLSVIYHHISKPRASHPHTPTQGCNLEMKQTWVKKLRELIQERLLLISPLNSRLSKAPRPPPNALKPSKNNDNRGSRCGVVWWDVVWCGVVVWLFTR